MQVVILAATIRHTSAQCDGVMAKGLESSKDGIIIWFWGGSRQVRGEGSVKSCKSCKQSWKVCVCMGHGCLAWAKLGGGVFIQDGLGQGDNVHYMVRAEKVGGEGR